MGVSALTPEKWKLVKVIVEEALERNPDERTNYVTSACEGDESLLKEINKMLAASAEVDSFLEVPANIALHNTNNETLRAANGDLATRPNLSLGYKFLDKYELLRVIGKGGMGQVYQARHIDLKKMVAIKVLHNHLTEEEGAIERFKREALAAAKLEHPNIVRVYDYGVNHKICYLIMEYMEGESLRERIKKRKMLSLPEVINFTEQISQALAVVHNKGIIHRDLKPENIFLHKFNDQDVVKLLDFGIAKVHSLTQNVETLTNPGDIFGTPHYMSPEQCQAKPLDSRSDIYSLGIIIYEMLTGIKPLEADNALSIMYAHVHTRPIELIDLVPDIPHNIAQVIMKTLEKNPADRYQNIEQFLAEFSQAIDNPAANKVKITSANQPSNTRAFASSADTLLIKSKLAKSEPEIIRPNSNAAKYWLTAAMMIVVFAFSLWQVNIRFFASPTIKPVVEQTPIIEKRSLNNSLTTPIPTAINNLADRLPANQFVLIKGGNITLGRRPGPCDYFPGCEFDEAAGPAHKEDLAAYYLGKFEVTNEEYQKFVSEEHYQPPTDWIDNKFPKGKAKVPVTNISWEDANNYCQWLAKKEGIPYRLATESEWEYAARGNTEDSFPWGNNWNNTFANVSSKKRDRSVLPINIAPNNSTDLSPMGVYAMAGNAREWTASDVKVYPNSHYVNTESDAQCKVIRGSSFKTEELAALTTYRSWDFPTSRYIDLGFRLAVSAK